MKKCYMDMNSDTSATDTNQKEYSMHNLKHDMVQDETIEMPSHDASAAKWGLFFKGNLENW